MHGGFPARLLAGEITLDADRLTSLLYQGSAPESAEQVRAAGFTTLVANAAGAAMSIYLLAMRLPKLGFLGTNAVFFLLLNWFKVPFMVNLGLVNRESLWLNLKLAPAVVVGCLIGYYAAARMNQKVFETTAVVLTAAAAVKLLFF